MAYGRITKKQTEILEYIKSQILNKGYPPSVRDICTAVNLKSTSSVLHIWKPWKRMDISAETLQSRVRLRL